MATRFPKSVYEGGSEPDSRFSFANERTFLAWIRTSLGLLAAALGIEYFGLPENDISRLVAVISLVLLSAYSAVHAWIGWRQSEIAMRNGQPLPGVGGMVVLSIGLASVLVDIAVGLLVG